MNAPSSPNPDPILAQLEWVRALCLRLVRDAAAADDLVQEVWLVAQARPPGSTEGAGSTRGWLARVAQNLARNKARSEKNRRHRERAIGAAAAAKRTAAPASRELVARSELLRLVATGTAQLDEPFKRTMLLRWFEGHSPTEIARLEDVPVGTVQSRLNRGRERLRNWMTIHYPSVTSGSAAGAERDWALALVPVAARALPLKTAGAWLGAKSMALGGLAAVAASGILLAGWINGTDHSGPPDAEQALAPLPVAPQESTATAMDESNGGDPSASLRVAVSPTAKSPVTASIPKDLTIRVRDHAGNPAPGLPLQVQSFPDEPSRLHAQIPWTTDEAGVAVVPNDRLERFGLGSGIVLASIVALDLPTITFDPKRRDLELMLPPTGSVIASFEDAGGTPITATGSAQLMAPMSDRSLRNRVYEVARDGKMVFRYVQPGLKRLSFTPGPSSSWMQEALLEGPQRAGETVHLLCLPHPNKTVFTARLVDRLGGPIPNLNVNLESPPGRQGDFLNANSKGIITFALPRREVGDPHKLRIVTKTVGPLEHAYSDLTVDVSTGEARRHLGNSVLEQPEICWAGNVTDVSGTPLAGADVSLTARAIGGRSIFHGISATTNNGGEFVLPEFKFSPGNFRAEGTYWLELSVHKIGFVAAAREVSGTRDLNLSMALMPTIRVSVHVEAPPQWTSWPGLMAKRVDEPEAPTRPFNRGLNGTFEAQLGPGTWQVLVYRRGVIGLPLLTLPAFDLAPGDSPKNLEPVQLEGHFREKPLRFEDESGTEVPKVELVLKDVTTEARGSVILEPGSALTLPIGPVRIRARGRTANGKRFREVTWTSTGAGSEVITLHRR